MWGFVESEHHCGAEDTIPRGTYRTSKLATNRKRKTVFDVLSHFKGETLHGLSVVCGDLLNLNIIVVQKTQLHEVWNI